MKEINKFVSNEIENKTNGHRGMFSNGNPYKPEFPGVSEEFVFDADRQIYIHRSDAKSLIRKARKGGGKVWKTTEDEK